MSSAVKTILFFAALLGALTWVFSAMLGPDTSGVKRLNEGVIQYFGPIDGERVAKFKKLYRPGDRLLINSNGGNIYAGIAMGKFINEKRMTVEIADLCISSCANYIFLAAETKVLNKNALVIFHGGPKQANFLSLLEQAYESDAPPGTVFGQADYEGVVEIESAAQQRLSRAANYGSPCALDEVQNQNGECEAISAKKNLDYLIQLENDLYQSINSNMSKQIPYLGQLGLYESTYLEYEYYGFFYSIESLQKLNVSNVYTKDTEWSAQGNSLFDRVYEVTID